jgi:galactokinase
MNKNNSIQLLGELKSNFTSHFGETDSSSIYLTPAVLILLGEHTHYNDGMIITAAVDRHTGIMLKRRSDENINLLINNKRYNLEQTIKNDNIARLIHDCIHQVLNELKERDIQISGFDSALNSNIPICLGRGSIAATQIGFLNALRDAFQLNFSNLDIINISRKAEFEKAGKISNKAHHYTAVYANQKDLMFVDLREEDHKYLSFAQKNYKIVVCDTDIKIENPLAICNERIEECEVGVKGLRLYIWGIKNLRDVEESFLKKHINMIPKIVYDKCLYNVKERERVEKAIKHLKQGKMKLFGSQMTESHNSLNYDYNISSDEINFLVEQAVEIDGNIGSKIICCSPIKCTLNIVKKNNVAKFVSTIEKKFKSKYKKKLSVHVLDFSVGSKKIVI